MIATGNWGACEWTISDEGELRIGSGNAEAVSGDGTYPWDEYRDRIRRISFDGEVRGVVSLIGAFMNCIELEEIDLTGLDTSNTVDMSWLLCGCGRLEHIDLSMLDTSKVVDMSCMFLSCSNLKDVEMGNIDTSSVMDMSKMFMYCSSLKSLDLYTMDNSALQMAEDMFFGCESLRAIVPGENFSFGGRGRTVIALPEFSEADQGIGEREDEKVKASDWRTSTDGVLYVTDTEFTVCYDAGEGQPVQIASGIDETRLRQTYKAGTQLYGERDLFEAPEDFVFKEWNTRRDGSGRTILPGQRFNVHYDMTLYAVWAGTPVFTVVHDIPAVEYGRLLELTQPEIDPRRGDITKLKTQITNPDGFIWLDFSNEEPLPVSRSGARIRYYAENFVGSAVSEEKSIRIERAHYDMSQVHWVLPENLSFNGEVKEVHLEGLPDGVTAEYAGNTASAVGDYRATALLRCDEDNYYRPDPVEDLQWSITKGRYSMGDLNWSYMKAFTYDGTSKSVRLEGLPEGTVPYYSGADAVDAGTYVATVGLDYDIDNYNSPDPIKPCIWKILKTTHDMSDVHWKEPEEFVYDGTPKKVELTGLPEGLRAEYTGNVAVDAGVYTARAAFVPEDPVNFEVPDPVEFSWEIRKAEHDMSSVAWTESQMVYDGSEQSIRLTGIPEGVEVLYDGDTATEAGNYTVRAEFCVEDLNNYNQIDPIIKNWEIGKADDIDMSRTRWNYSSPYIYNGTEKSVELKNIPPQIVSVTYTGERGIDAGSYTANAEFTLDSENHKMPHMEACSWSILKADLKIHDLKWNYEGPFTYDGMEHSVHIVNLPGNAVVTYEGDCATTVGVYETRATITPLDTKNFNTPQPVTLKWEIHKAVFDISGFHWAGDQGCIFDGETKTVEIQNLPEGVSVSYKGNQALEAGDYTARAVFSVEDTDNFLPPQPEELQWNIAPAPIDLSGVRWDYSSPFVYDGSEKEIRLKGLPEGVTARYEGNVASDAGEYSAQATLLPPEGSSYRETKILGTVWKIEKADIDISEARWGCSDDLVYDRMLKRVEIKGLPDGLHVDYTGNEAVDAGTYQAEAVLTPYDEDNFNAPEMTGYTWQIAKADIDISDVEWSGYETFVYNGTVHRVILRNLPATLEAVYEGNAAADAGNYIATAEFVPTDQNNYNAPHRIQYEWSVAKAQLTDDNVYWTSDEDDLIYNGKEHTIRLAGLPENVKASYQGNTAVDAGQYIASAVLESVDKTNYLPCVIEPHRWEIEKAEIDISNVMWASSGELVYDGSLKVIGLTGLSDDVSVEYENNVAVNAGTYHASAVISTKNKNYIAPEIEGCTWTIAKAVPDISKVAWTYDFEFIYDGYEKSVHLMNLPKGMTVQYHGNEAIEAGEYLAEATLVMDDPLNYEAPRIKPLHWKIGKRDYDMSRAVWIGTEGFVYDGEAKSVKLTGLEEGLEPIYTDNVAVDVGVYKASARFLYDEDNYNPPQDLYCTWEIRKAPLDTSGVKWTYEAPFRANNKIHTVTLCAEEGPQQGFMDKMFGKNKEQKYIGLPEGTTVRYEGNTARAPGVYEAKAYLNVPPQLDHEVKGPICLTWEIIDD